MRFSLIIVTLNSERYLSETLESIKGQEFIDFEVILKDGGSTDNTLNIFRSFSDNDDRLKLISNKDNGLSDAMNQGVSAASGEYVIFLHSDDKFFDKYSLSKINNVILAEEFPDWGFGFYQYSNEDGEIIKSDNVNSKISFFQMSLRNIVRHQSAFVRRTCFNHVSFSGTYKYAMDYDFFIKIWTMFGEPAVIREYLSVFRISGSNLSSNYYASISDEMSVRKAWRKRSSKLYKFMFLFDSFVYFLRVKKLKYYYGKK